MAKNKLKVDFIFDFTLFGLISVLKEHKLAWEINRAMDIHLVKNEDVILEFFNQGNIVISNFIFETENSSFRLLKNKSMDTKTKGSKFLLPELNSFDYLVFVTGFEDTFSTGEAKEMLQSVPGIQYLKEFDPNGLKSKENLIF